MDELTALAIIRRFFPGLAAVLVAAAFYFAPTYSTATLMRVANERAESITSLLNEAFESTLTDSRQRQRQAR